MIVLQCFVLSLNFLSVMRGYLTVASFVSTIAEPIHLTLIVTIMKSKNQTKKSNTSLK